MNIGSLYASFGIDMSSMSKDISKAETMFKQLGGSIGSISEEAEEGILKLFKQKMPDAFNTMQQKFLAMQDESQSFIDYIRNNMPGAFQKMAVEFIGASDEMKAGMKESETAVDGVAGTVEILKNSLANMNMASEQRKALLHEEMQSLVELQIRKQAAYDPEDLIKYDNEIKNVQKRIQLLTDKTSEFKDISMMSLGEMKLELRRLKNTPLELASPEHMAAMKQRMAQLTDAVGDYGKQLRMQGDSVNRFITTMQGMVGIVQAVSGTLALFGVENENVEKSMLALMNVSQALSTFHDLNEKGILKEIAARVRNTFAINAETAALRAQAATGGLKKPTSIKGVDVGKLSLAPIGQQATTAAGGVKALGVAMKLLPWAALAAGIGAAIYGIVDYVSNLRELKEAQENWKKVMTETSPAIKANKAIYDETIKSIRNLGIEYDVLTNKISESQATQIRNTTDAEEKKSQIRANFVSDQLNKEEAMRKLLQEKEAAYQKSVSQMTNTGIEVRQMMEKQHKDALKQIKVDTFTEIYHLQKNAWAQMDKVDEEARLKTKIAEEQANKEKLQEAQQAWQEYLSQYKSWLQKIQDMQDDMIVSDEGREIAKLQRRRDRDIEELNLSKLNAEQKGQMILAITDFYLRQEEAIHDKYAKQRADDADQARQTEIAKVEQYYDDLNAKMDDAEQRRNDLVNTYLTLRSQNETLSHQERINALLQLEDIRYKEEQEKYKGQAAILEQLAIQHAQNMAAINKTAFDGETAAIDWAEQWKQAADQVKQAVESAAESMVISAATMIGEGKKSAEDFEKMVLTTLADLAITVGKIAVTTGITVGAIVESLESLNPVVAVLAGASLIALGTWAKSSLAKAASGGGSDSGTALQGLATGGQVMKSGSFIVGEKGPEIVNLPGRASVTPNHMLGGFGDMQLVGVIQGSDLKIILDRAEAKTKRR